jgi:hypothetical protein
VQQVLLEFGAQAGERRGIVAIALFTRILDQVVEFAEALPPTSNLDPIATNKGRDTQLEAAITEVRRLRRGAPDPTTAAGMCCASMRC